MTSSLIPVPVSIISILINPSGNLFTLTIILPELVNFKEFPIKFIRTYLSRFGSVKNYSSFEFILLIKTKFIFFSRV